MLIYTIVLKFQLIDVLLDFAIFDKIFLKLEVYAQGFVLFL